LVYRQFDFSTYIFCGSSATISNGEKTMTIKRQIFFSNIRMMLVIIGGSMLIAAAVSIFVYFFSGSWLPHNRSYAEPEKINVIMRFFPWILFIIIVGIINNLFTIRLTNRILKPLGPLSEGVKQIHNSNYAYRIDYQKDDEFRPVCEAFNEMAARLERSTIQRQKEEANRRELIAGISHDLRTPLTSIKGYLEGIEIGVASTPEMQKQYFSIIISKTAELEHIIEQLFLFSKLDMDEFPLNMRNVDIVSSVSDIIEDTISEYAVRGLDIRLAKMPVGAFVLADTLWLRNVIINIFENSVKYKTKEHGQIKISAVSADNFILFHFADNGPGVQADALSKLFDVFYRADPSRNKKGSGLGLAISAKIIERMGGSIHAELPVTGGLSIVIKLPLLPKETL
jgi:signal transduction histidine kinase